VDESNSARRPRVPFAWLLDWWLRNWRRIALVLVALLGAVLIVRAVANLWLGQRLHRETARLEKIYGRLDPATLAPSARVLPSENRARMMRAAANLTTVNGQAVLQSFLRGHEASPDDQKIVEDNRLAVQVAEQARRRPKSNWDIDYGNNDANIPRLLDIRTLGEVLAVTCRVDLDAGRANEAAEAALAGLAEASSLGHEPVLVLQLIRIAVAEAQLDCIRDLLQRGDPSAAVLAELADALAENRSPDPMHIAFVGELKHVDRFFLMTERGQGGVYAVGLTGNIGHRPAAWPIIWLARPLIRAGHLRFLEEMGRLIEVQTTAPFARRPSGAKAWPRATRARWWEVARQFDALFLPGLERADEAGYEYQSILNAADVAVALRRFRLDHGAYPDALAALAPRYLAKVPVDPFTGKPPEYKRDGAGFDLRARGAGRYTNQLLEWKIAR